ncbi:hypothetical protein [uncultured Tateyamaria sp.]|uniref:hypothetical protein n=1 Tax=uncultured Tateyamaria sp. TaxID=455651 RepID=UPI002611B9D3|nr:hypothetical protein [uncultured Tateyamaria sp.]
MTDHTKYCERLHRVVNLDIGNRGIEARYDASGAFAGGPQVGVAADRLLALLEGGTVIVTTGPVYSVWLSPARRGK